MNLLVIIILLVLLFGGGGWGIHQYGGGPYLGGGLGLVGLLIILFLVFR